VNPIDVWLESGVPLERGATTGDDERRIDYIFIITDPELAKQPLRVEAEERSRRALDDRRPFCFRSLRPGGPPGHPCLR
jgi:hypothetical protein